MFVDLLIIFFLILLNGFFALAEMALVSSRRAKLKLMRTKGAAAAAGLIREPHRYLSTVQAGVTLTGVLAGAFGGATLGERIADALAGIPALDPYREGIGVAAVVIPITVLSIVLGELVPKRIALISPERHAARVARPMRFFAAIFAPIVNALTWASSLFIRLLGVRAESAAAVTEEEIRHVVQEGAESGAILRVERDMVNRIFRLGDKLVDDVMTPRPQIVSLDQDESVGENLSRMREARFSRYPVFRGDPPECVGVVRAKDLAFRLGQPETLDLFRDMRAPLFVPDTTRALDMLDRFKSAGLHMALVVDEYGDVKGLVTPTDILEAIVGEMASTPGEPQSSISVRDDGSLLVDGLCPIDELKEKLELAELPGEAEHDFNTLAGLVLANMEEIPREGDAFEAMGYRFEVVDMDGRRIDKVLVTKKPAPEAEDYVAED